MIERFSHLLLILVLLVCYSVYATAQNTIVGPPPKKTNTTTTMSTSSSAATTAKTGGLSVQYTPSGAAVYVDGSKKGTTPCELSGLSAGNHTVKISLSGYETATRTVSITAGGVREMAGTLTKQAVATTTSSGSSSSTSSSTSASGTINGHAYVDLGLSVKWATCNVGASSPEDYGNCYAWGETSTKSTYTEDNSKTYGKSSYNYDISGDASLDAARANWGGTWRLPTKAEMQELLNKCTWTWTTQGGKKGCKVTGPSGWSIFLPAAGGRSGSSLGHAGSYGFYWTSTPGEDYAYYAYYLNFIGSSRRVDWSYRYVGRSVRPVSE